MSVIVWSGGVWGADIKGGGEDSFSIINRKAVVALDRLGVDVRLDAWEIWDWNPAYRDTFLDYELLLAMSQADRDVPDAVTIRQSWPVCEPYYDPKFNWSTMRGRRRIGFFVWESEHMPPAWIAAAASVDAIITISFFSAERVTTELRSHGVQTPVWAIPLGVDSRVFHPLARPRPLAARSFRFLYVGGWQLRKGSDLLRQAYLEEFTDADDVSLVVQSRQEEGLVWTADLPPGAPHILVVRGNVPEVDMGGIYTACHCLVHPARLEGFGMTMLEAMACGIPVLCPDRGGQRAFATADNAVLLPTVEEQFPFPFDLVGAAYRVDIPALRRAMRAAFQGGYPMARVEQGLRTAMQFSWERCAAQIMKHVETLDP